MPEKEYTLRKAAPKPETSAFALDVLTPKDLAQKDFQQAITLANGLSDNRTRVLTLGKIGIDQVRAGFDPQVTAGYLIDAAEGVEEDRDPKSLRVKREALYEYGRIVLESGDPQLAFEILQEIRFREEICNQGWIWI